MDRERNDFWFELSRGSKVEGPGRQNGVLLYFQMVWNTINDMMKLIKRENSCCLNVDIKSNHVTAKCNVFIK